MEVSGIPVLSIAIIILKSCDARAMKASDNNYDSLNETDDAVAQTEAEFRGAFNEITRDGEVPLSVEFTAELVAEVLKREVLQKAITNLVVRILEAKQVQEACQILLKNLWDDLVNDPETLAQVVKLLNHAIQNPEIEKAVQQLVLKIIQDKAVYDELTRLLVQLGKDKEVRQRNG